MIEKLRTARVSLSLKFIIGTGIVLTMALGMSFYVLAQRQEKLMISQIENEARILFKQIVLTRRWIADHGGIFVERLPWVKPNPYLKDMEPEIVDIKGRRYVKKNPAMVTKELSKYAMKDGVYWFHITSLKLLNPENAPDEFERWALHEFEAGNARELFKIEKAGLAQHLRYISPLYIESACLDCHARQSYKIGDVRGAISITIPMDDTSKIIKTNRVNMLVATFLIVGILLMALYGMVRGMILSPIHKLKAFIKDFTDGAYSTKDTLRTGDELEDLGISFSEMAKSLVNYHNCLHDRVSTATKSLEDANLRLTQANEMLMEINKKKSDFVAKVSHELRTPLTSIKGAMDYISTRLSAVISEKGDKLDDLFIFFEVIKKNADRLIRMVNDILDLERIEMGKTEMHFTVVDISQLVNEVVTTFQSDVSGKNIEFKIKLDDKLLISVDEDRIRQVLINLLFNAVKFSPEGSSILIEASSSNEWVIVMVRDRGPGIQREDQKMIFEKFYKKGTKEGSGLGLAICKGIVEAHSGVIGVVSDGKNGSCFYFKLPKIKEAFNEE